MSTTANFEAVRVLSESAYNSLSSTPDNTLYFVELPMDAYITETYHNGSSWYRVWSDGFIEQGGSVSASSITSNVSISFLKNFSSTNYVVVATSVSPTSYSSNTSNASRNFVIEWASTLCLKGQSGISRCRTNDGSYSWYACGY